MLIYKDFKKVQSSNTRVCGYLRVVYSPLTGGDICVYSENLMNNFDISWWCRKHGICWQEMTEDEFNIMKFEYELKRKK